MTDLFEQRLRAAVRELPVPPAPDDLIARVIDERARGERIILPAEAVRTQRGRRWAIGIAVAAASVVTMIAFGATSQAVRSLFGISTSSADSLASEGSFFVSSAYAAQTSNGPSFPPLVVAAQPALRPGTYRYRLQYVDAAGAVTPDGTGVVHISEAVVIPGDSLDQVAKTDLHNGRIRWDWAPAVGSGQNWGAWIVEHQSHSTVSGQLRVEAETLVVAKRDLRPITRDVTVRPYSRYSAIHITQYFKGDSVVGEMTVDGGVRRPIARRLSPGYAPYLSDALAPFTLMGVPLSKNWKASLSIVGWAVMQSDVFYPVALRVIGEERLDTPFGSVDCWKVAVDAGQEHRIEWVRKSDGLGLRSYDERSTPRGHRVYDLLSLPQ